jgi:hypothetical protein
VVEDKRSDSSNKLIRRTSKLMFFKRKLSSKKYSLNESYDFDYRLVAELVFEFHVNKEI